MKRFLILVLLFPVLAFGQATDVWVTQAGAGAATGADLANAAAVTFITSVANCGAGATQVGPDTTIHLSGTFTYGVNAAGIRFDQMACSGTLGHPIKLKLEVGADITSPQFYYGGGSAVGGGLNIAGRSYIVVDGGVACGTTAGANNSPTSCTGTIQNTDNGTAFANHAASTLIDSTGCTPGCEIKNIGLYNSYVRAPNWPVSVTCVSGTCTATGAQTVGTSGGSPAKIALVGSTTCGFSATTVWTVTGGGTSWTFTDGTLTCGPEAGLTAVDEITVSVSNTTMNAVKSDFNSAGMKLHDSNIHDAGWAVIGYSSSATVPFEFYNNQVYNIDHGFSAGVPTAYQGAVAGPLIHDNHFYDMVNWNDTISRNTNHHDFVHLQVDVNNNPQNYFDGYLEYSNRFDGDVGTPNDMSFNRASSTNSAIFNNIFGCTNLAATAFQGTDVLGIGDDTFGGSLTTNVLVANNSFLCSGQNTGDSIYLPGTTIATVSGIKLQNNVVRGLKFDITVKNSPPFPAGYFAASGVSNNIWEKVVTDAPCNGVCVGVWPFIASGASTTYMKAINDTTYDNSLSSSPANYCWSSSSGTYCKNAALPAATGQDTNAQLLTFAAMKINSSGTLQTGSPLVGAAADLTSLCTGTLTALCTDINGVARPNGSAWDAGAYQYVSGPTATLSATSIAFGDQAQNTTSAPTVITVTNNGSVALNIASKGLTTGTQFCGGVACTSTCGATLAAAASCTVTITFSPTGIASYSDTYTFVDDASDSPQTISLTGTGTVTAAPTGTLTPSVPAARQGSTFTLAWTSTNATSGSIDNGVGAVTPIASGTTSPITVNWCGARTYTLDLSGAGGTTPVTASVYGSCSGVSLGAGQSMGAGVGIPK